MTDQEHIDRIDQRRRYLEKRIEAKRSVGWETVYDESEHAALAWALERLPAPTPRCACGVPAGASHFCGALEHAWLGAKRN